MTIAFLKTIPILRIFSVEKAFEDNTPAYIQVSRDGLTLYLSEHHGDC